jgi:hypothetical protein
LQDFCALSGQVRASLKIVVSAVRVRLSPFHVLPASLYDGYHRVFSPRGQKRWILDRERFARRPGPARLLGGT